MPVSARLVALGGAFVALVGCSAPGDSDAATVHALDGDPARGRSMLRKYGCQSCHMIPGVDGANGLVGPSLAGIASRTYIAGVLTNTPDNMTRWIIDPRGVDSLTAMPNVGVTPDDARHIVAYLYTLRQ